MDFVSGGESKARMRTTISGSATVADAIAFARAFSAEVALPPDPAARLCIIVEELVANACEHGGASCGPIDLSLALEGDTIGFVMSDRGPAFDLSAVSVTLPKPERGGGVGLELVRAWTTRLRYRVSEAGNRLELIIPLERQGSQAVRSEQGEPE